MTKQTGAITPLRIAGEFFDKVYLKGILWYNTKYGSYSRDIRDKRVGY